MTNNNRYTTCDNCSTRVLRDALNLDDEGNALCDTCFNADDAAPVRKKRDYNRHDGCGHPLTPKARAACRKAHRTGVPVDWKAVRLEEETARLAKWAAEVAPGACSMPGCDYVAKGRNPKETEYRLANHQKRNDHAEWVATR